MASVSNPHNQDHEPLILDARDHPIITDAILPEFTETLARERLSD